MNHVSLSAVTGLTDMWLFSASIYSQWRKASNNGRWTCSLFKYGCNFVYSVVFSKTFVVGNVNQKVRPIAWLTLFS